MEELYRKTIFCIHEYNPRQFKDRFLNKVLQKVPKILFDSDAGKQKWLDILPEIASKSQTVHPGIPKKLIKDLVNPNVAWLMSLCDIHLIAWLTLMM